MLYAMGADLMALRQHSLPRSFLMEKARLPKKDGGCPGFIQYIEYVRQHFAWPVVKSENYGLAASVPVWNRG